MNANVIYLMILVAVTMGLKDVLFNAATVFVAREKAALAAIFDMMGDWSQVLTIGVGGTTAIQHGLSFITILVFAAMGVGSLIGAYGGVGLAQIIERKMGIDIPHRLSPKRISEADIK